MQEKDATEKNMFPNCAVKQPYSQEIGIHSGSLKLIEFAIIDT
jgi:hypothetical protein